MCIVSYIHVMMSIRIYVYRIVYPCYDVDQDHNVYRIVYPCYDVDQDLMCIVSYIHVMMYDLMCIVSYIHVMMSIRI